MTNYKKRPLLVNAYPFQLGMENGFVNVADKVVQPISVDYCTFPSTNTYDEQGKLVVEEYKSTVGTSKQVWYPFIDATKGRQLIFDGYLIVEELGGRFVYDRSKFFALHDTIEPVDLPRLVSFTEAYTPPDYAGDSADAYCPSCDYDLNEGTDSWEYCPKCGIKICWNVVEYEHYHKDDMKSKLSKVDVMELVKLGLVDISDVAGLVEED